MTDDIYEKINAPRLALVDKLAQGLADGTPVTLTLDEMAYLHEELSEFVNIPLLDNQDILKMIRAR